MEISVAVVALIVRMVMVIVVVVVEVVDVAVMTASCRVRAFVEWCFRIRHRDTDDISYT